MGHNSKKKKRRGGGGGKRNKVPTGDHASLAAESSELIAEELTALCAIFQEDCKVVSESPPQIIIKLRPYLKDMGYEDADVSAVLSVRCLPGYPYKCPKLQITPEEGLSRIDADKLLSLLQDQANSNAREGRVMIFNLVEAAQEFLSEIVSVSQSSKPVPYSSIASGSHLFQDDTAILRDAACSSSGPFVYGFVDIFSGSRESWWDFGMDDNRGIRSSTLSDGLDGPNVGNAVLEKKLEKTMKSSKLLDIKHSPLVSSAGKLDILEEESEVGSESSISFSSGLLVDELAGSGKIVQTEDLSFEKLTTKDGDDEEDPQSVSLESLSSAPVVTERTPEKDLVMVHLLRLACGSKGPLADALPDIAEELYNLGIFSEWLRDLATKPPSLFNKSFDHVFCSRTNSTRISQFWKPTANLGVQASSLPSSRYLSDFEELQPLGHGGFGHVVLCKNKLDGRQYAIKMIRLKDESLPLNDRILREVATLSRLQHQHVVRYYQAWFEMGVSGSYVDALLGSRTSLGSTYSKDACSGDLVGHENRVESTFLYIQMEYCPRTLRQDLESYNHFDEEKAWHLFRQIVEGLVHIHGQGIIHRDLTPSNIFFDSRNDIKIGDFGLAKFLKFEQLDQDLGFPADATGVSGDGTGQVGTYFYTAPEIEQGWPKIDEKADMYSLGVVFFELWHPFGTAMERHVVLSNLKLKGELPPTWVAEFPEQASLLRRMMSSSPSNRPSAIELLQHAFPPRMEYELLDNMLRTMQTSEDTKIYDKVVSSIFDDDILSMKYHRQHVGRLRLVGEDTSSIQYTDLATERRDHVVEITREGFRSHCAKHLEIIPMRLLDDLPQFNRNTVKLLTHGGGMIELCHELRLPFICWTTRNQKSSYKRYEIAFVYRRAIGHSTPNHYLQGDFDIIGGAPAVTEAEVIKVTLDIVKQFFPAASLDIHLNHGDLFEAIWSWIGIKVEHRQKVAELLSMMNPLRPQSSKWKSKWVVIRRQLLQELSLAEAVVNRLQTVGLRFCGSADQALPRLRGALPSDKSTRKALDELSDLFNYLRVWKIEKNVVIDALMPPTEYYHRDVFFQMYVVKANNPGTLIDGLLLAIGGRYDYLLHQMWDHEYKSNPPGAVGTSLALETIIQHSSEESKPYRNEASANVLVCSRGGGGLLEERMELVDELWEENIKADFVPISDPSLREQYEYANEHDIKCLVIIQDTRVSQTDLVKVRHLELKKEKEVLRENLVKFLSEAMATQFRNPSIWI